MTEPAPDYYTELAAQLHKVADQLAALAGWGIPSLARANLYLTPSHAMQAAEVSVPVVDAICGALGGQAETAIEGPRGEHKARIKLGVLTVVPYASFPAPPTDQQRLADLQRENDELRARLAARAEHYETGGWVNDGPGSSGVECACGVVFDGFASLAKAGEQLAIHIRDAQATR